MRFIPLFLLGMKIKLCKSFESFVKFFVINNYLLLLIIIKRMTSNIFFANIPLDVITSDECRMHNFQCSCGQYLGNLKTIDDN